VIGVFPFIARASGAVTWRVGAARYEAGRAGRHGRPQRRPRGPRRTAVRRPSVAC